jgi:translation initiation factor 3 subunit C
MNQYVDHIQNGKQNKDWVVVEKELDGLFNFMNKHMVAMAASSTPPAGHVPPEFLGTVLDLEPDVAEALEGFKADKPKTKPQVLKHKAVQSMKQILKKKLPEYSVQIKAYQEDADAYEDAYVKANTPPKQAAAAATPAIGADGELVDGEFTTIGRGGRQLALTADGVFKTLREIVDQRGRKNTDRAETIRILTKLLEVSNTTYQKIRVLLALIPARLDYSQNLSSIPHDSWVHGLGEYNQLISLLLANPGYVIQETVEEFDDMAELEPTQGSRVAVPGNLISLLENLDNEFAKTLQHTDAHERGTEYIARLREEAPLYTVITKSQALFERETLADQTTRAIMRRLEHVYAKPDGIVDHFEAGVNKALEGLTSNITPFGVQRDASGLIHLLCVYIYHSDAPLLRARAILAHIFNHAVHSRYHQARDLLLMSHLQDTIQQADVATQIMYNRAVVQLGLAAFRRGFIHECQTILSEIFQTGRQKELLAQAVHRHNVQLSPEQELIEKRRLLPFHMHLNVELLEAAYLTSCMLIEIPLLASVDTEEQRRRIASKGFKRLLDGAEKQAFMGPPENTKDHIMKASKALQAGEWEQARDLILSIKMWQLLDNVEDVQTMLTRKIQEEGLRTYLFTYSPHYASLSLAHLAETFALPQQAVTSIISRMIYTDELAASLDQIDAVVVFHRVEQTEVQRLAQQLAEKVVTMVDANEKTLDVKLGQAPGNDRTGASRDGPGGDQRGNRGERRTGGGQRGAGGSFRGRGRGRTGFNSGLGNQRRVAA